MKILLSNDDGFESPGIRLLFDRLVSEGFDPILVAPHRERSTAGHSLTLHKPLRIHEIKKNIYAVSGSPADCVHLALRKILGSKPDLIISGINRGANLGHDIFYSGTVAAAREGYLYGIPALAVSLCIGFPKANPQSPNWETGISFVSDFVLKLRSSKISKQKWFLNANVPDIPRAQVKGVKFASQGHRIYSDEVVEGKDPRGRPYYWIGGGPSGFDPIPNSDCVAVADNYVALTSLNVDTTHHEEQKRIETSFDINWK